MAHVVGGQERVVARLLELGVDRESAHAVATVAGTPTEALDMLGREPDGSVTLASTKWKEFYSQEHQRLYYCNDENGANTWDAPPCFRYSEWALDAQLYGISVPKSRDIYIAIDSFLTRHPPDKVYKALAVLAKATGNVADCDNRNVKFRSVKTDNPKFAEAVWDVPGAAQVLFAAGWKAQSGRVELPEGSPLGPTKAAASRLRRLADRKGHTGRAESVAPDDATGKPRSQFYGKPGFRYQERIYHCSACDHPINDGSERLFTGKHDAPLGEYRYECTTCQAPFHLCQSCWDRFQGGSALHDRGHSFQHVGPRMTRHNDYYGARGGGGDSDPSGSNPWGRPSFGSSYARALSRMKERYGIHDLG